MIRFDCGLTLKVWVERPEVRWSLEPTSVVTVGEEFQRVGAPPITLNFAETIGVVTMDASAMVARRRGARFKDLFYNESGLFIYLHGHMILDVMPIECVDDGRCHLYAMDDD